ncbi:MAG: hypothetical protein CR975_00955 [Gammaproteobacteria bacterium]|nr:MAG: hypothetical protein CR975_00955 [Gammaproteobacteria bacterium]
MKNFVSGLLILSCLGLVACNTVSGAGKDIRATGSAISNAADKAKQKL